MDRQVEVGAGLLRSIVSVEQGERFFH
jgi:hypothetical protein